MRSVVWWIRRDVRTEDNATLAAAAGAGEVHPVVVRDRSFPGGTRRHEFWLAALHDVHRTSGGVAFLSGGPETVLLEYAKRVGASQVYASKDFGPYGSARDEAVSAALRSGGVELLFVDTPYLRDFDTLCNKDGSAIRTFSAWRRQWMHAPLIKPVNVGEVSWAAIGGAGVIHRAIPEASTEWQYKRLHDWVATLSAYPDGRDYPARDATSRLSVGLRFGLIHPRSILTETGGRDGGERLADQLCWREWYGAQLGRNGAWAWEAQDRTYAGLVCDTGVSAEARFLAWCEGRTGYPLVDAGMRELRETGYMHNRVRMVAASFLVKHLHFPWQRGAAYFMQQLFDGDLASNNLSWQWVAGVGLDASPYFRIMNPTAQAEKFDPEGTYIKTHITELRDFEGTCTTPGANGYATPVVDLAVERDEALARYKTARAGR
jgi:deoxyribodipyrimidine photo-lyase